jgi:hypothetical protein
MRPITSRVVVAVAAIVVLVLCAGAPAGLAATSCESRTLSQPFLPWLDPAGYFLVPNGGFEGGTASWTLAGGAAVVAGNESFFVRSASDTRSLAVPVGGWAQSNALCVDQDEPTLRFFARHDGSMLATLAIEARIRTTLLGITTETTVPLGVLTGLQTTWAPSLPVAFSLSPNQLLGRSTVSFRFTPLLGGGSWLIDDVYVDPFKDH